MIKVEQTRTEIGKGNCFQACLASIFEIPIEEVPDWNRNGETRWLDLYDKWLAERGLAMTLVGVGGNPYREYPKDYYVYWIGGFESLRFKGLHAVVMKNYQIEWDPHPLREMGVGELVDCTFFLPLDLPGMLHARSN
jgi:hypothetical protein